MSIYPYSKSNSQLVKLRDVSHHRNCLFIGVPRSIFDGIQWKVEGVHFRRVPKTSGVHVKVSTCERGAVLLEDYLHEGPLTMGEIHLQCGRGTSMERHGNIHSKVVSTCGSALLVSLNCQLPYIPLSA